MDFNNKLKMCKAVTWIFTFFVFCNRLENSLRTSLEKQSHVWEYSEVSPKKPLFLQSLIAFHLLQLFLLPMDMVSIYLNSSTSKNNNIRPEECDTNKIF